MKKTRSIGIGWYVSGSANQDNFLASVEFNRSLGQIDFLTSGDIPADIDKEEYILSYLTNCIELSFEEDVEFCLAVYSDRDRLKEENFNVISKMLTSSGLNVTLKNVFIADQKTINERYHIISDTYCFHENLSNECYISAVVALVATGYRGEHIRNFLKFTKFLSNQ